MGEVNDIVPSKTKFATKQAKVKIILPAIALVTSFYYSFSFTGGIVIGYVLCKVFCNLFVKNGKIDSIFLDYGKWRFHLHHWIMGIILLAIVWTIDHYYLPTLFAGVVCGVIIQDIYDYNDWHKVIIKNPNSGNKKAA
ncbi:MAG: hypothetical protein A2908_04290 [Candidatus Staskawiczbacteria bacterium RIFCSPLOWO2_01_FULL_38_12b]|uniref:Uncharacterized protein n=1 Tax=Candidatus Staskawiczbacteria bacterium RIFCSPLOWO2_01_FULL_38_12b TaxID=1802214 RepID=A0A1G2IC98_9BACT|nr:MAG: hypothetical protein A2908_04290 [Candidatus Staskawiczbacteria bacterium RIFCSPLOWO2_01_FULL_38_12b]